MSLDKKLFSIASSAIEKQQKARDGRNAVSKSLDIATNKSYANEDKKVAAAALRQWENDIWKPKVEAKLKQELQRIAPKLKPGSPKYQETYQSLYNKNYKDLQAAKAKAQQQIGTLRKPQQTQRQLDNEYRQNEAVRNNTTGAQAVAHAIRDTGEAVSGALATGASRTLRYPLQLAADVGENDDGGIFDRGAKALERHEDNLQQVYPAYADIQQGGNFGQKLAISAVEQVPTLAASFGTAGAAAKGVQLLGAGAKTAAAVSYGTAAATMYPQAYGDGSDSTKQELENATPGQLATAVRSKDIYKGHFDKNIKAGMSEDDAYQKARDQTISSIAEESGDAVGLATLALSMLAPGVGSFTANRIAGGAVSSWGQKVFNTLAVKADAGKVAKVAIPAAVGASIVGLNVAEEGLQEGLTDYVAQKAAVDVGVKDKVDTAQTKEAVLMGGILGGLMGGGVYVGTRNSKLHQAQDDLKTAQQTYAEVAEQIPQLQQQIETVSPRSPEGQALTAQLEETRGALEAMAAEAEKHSIPRTSLARLAPRIDPTNSFSTEFDGQADGATELSAQDFENALNPDGTPAAQAPTVQPMSEAELDAQDAQIAELIAEQAALDEAIEDGSNDVPLEESIAKAQSWYDSKRGEGKQGLAGVVSRAAATEQDAAFAQQQESIKGTTASINDYIANERTKQRLLDEEIEQDALAAKTEREKKEVEQRARQREIDRAQEDELLAKRVELAQPYESESFDTTIIGADGAPFRLARFWDSSMPASAKAKAIADAFGGQVDQNIAKADWRSMPEGVQKELHQWFTERLNNVRQSREGGEQTAEQVAAPAVEQTQEVAPTASSLTMPVEQEPIAPVEVEQVAEIDSTPAATQLTDENPVINIPAPTQAKVETPAPTTDEGIYKSKPAAKAAIKKQKLDPNSVTIKQVKGGGFEIVPNAPAKPNFSQAQEQAATELGMTLNEDGEYGGTDAEFEEFAKRVDEIQGRSLSNSKPTPVAKTEPAPNNDVAIGKDGQAKWFGKQDKAQAFIDKKGISDTHEVVQTGKSRFEIQLKQTTGATNQTSTPIDVISENGSPNTQELTATGEAPPQQDTAAPTKAPRELSDRAMVREMQKPTTNNGEIDYRSKLNLSEGQNLGRLIMSSGRVFDDVVVKSMDDKGVTVEATVNGKRGLNKGMSYQTVDSSINNTKSYAKQQATRQGISNNDNSSPNTSEENETADSTGTPRTETGISDRDAPQNSDARQKQARAGLDAPSVDQELSLPKTYAQEKQPQSDVAESETVVASSTKPPQSPVAKAETVPKTKKAASRTKPKSIEKPASSDDNAGTSKNNSTVAYYSKTNPAKGNTGTTAKQVVSILQKRFGKEVVAALIKSGKLRVRTLNDFVNADGRLLIPSDAEGFYHRGKVVLIADNLTTDTAVATLLHELGGHAGIQSMLETQTYMSLMENFYTLVRSGNKYAVRAKERAEAMTDNELDAREEYIPYLITEYAQATERGGPLAVIKRFVNRVMAGVRAWVRNHTGVQLKITPNDITQLAERMVKRLAEQSASDITIAGMDNVAAMPQYSQENDILFSQLDAPQSQLDAVRKQYENTDEWMKSPNGSDTNLTEQQWLQVRTPAFKEWFGDWEGDPDNASKVIDDNGEPMVVYHGTPHEFSEFDADKKLANHDFLEDDTAFFFSADKENAEWYADEFTETGDTYVMEVFLNIKDPLQVNNKIKNKDAESAFDPNSDRYLNEMRQDGYDGIIVTGNTGAKDKMFVMDNSESIKSATDNVGTFDPSNNDIRYSRRYSSLGSDGKPTTAKERARDRVALAQATTMSSKFGVNLLLRRHLATPQHVALLNPVFKIFTDNVQARIAYENNEAGLVQTYLPEIWDTRLVVGKKKAAMERVSKAIFDGTMADKVWSDSELQTMFDLTDKDINFYRRARQAIDTSVMNMTVDTLSSLAKGTKLVSLPTVQRLKLQGLHPEMHSAALQKHMTDELEKLAKGGLISAKAEARMQKQLDAVFDIMSAVAGKYDKLVEDGYAPLMRFGHYAVEVRDKNTNELDLFELYETKGQQRKAIKELKERYDESQFTVGTGTLNPEGFKQFKNKGLSPETVQLFAAELGLDEDGAHQAYLKIAVSDRSALKRLIHRKKVPGYSEDMPRVLSSFVMSNARYSGRSLYNSEIERSIQNIEDGNLQNEAQKVFENMENPQEEFAQQRSLMFHYFMGFSPAFLFLNLTQPFTQTIPKLTAYVGAGKGHAYMAQALGIVSKNMGASAINMGKKAAGLPTPNWKGFEDSLPAWVKKEDYLRMAREGHLDPQNIYMIKGLERGKGGVASGVWGNIEAAAGWPAEVSESINRRSTMIAAFKVAHDMGDAKLKAKGFDSKYDFAVSIIQQTQGIYNKANRSGLARGNGKLGQYGPLILVFKQFTINYTEQMIRHGRDKEVKALAVAMMWQFALAGMLGLPFADDLRDIFEGIAYRVFGKAFNLPDYLQEKLGKSNADALMYGIVSEKTRIDIHGRSSLGNVIPGTDVVRPGPTDWAEILGASSGFYESFFSAASMAAEGKYKDALITASPRYIRDAASGAEIAITGSYRNTRGDKIMDLDKTDAVIKSMAFNPSNNARPGRDRSNAYQMKNMLQAKTDYFSKHLAEAIYQDDDARVDELYNEMDAWNERNAEHFNVDIDKIEKSAEKRVERKDFGSAERQNIQDSLALRQEELAGT